MESGNLRRLCTFQRIGSAINNAVNKSHPYGWLKTAVSVYYGFNGKNIVIVSCADDNALSGIGGMDNLPVSDIKTYMGTFAFAVTDNISRLDFLIRNAPAV